MWDNYLHTPVPYASIKIFNFIQHDLEEHYMYWSLKLSCGRQTEHHMFLTVHRSNLVSYGDIAFAHVTPHWWNSKPAMITISTTGIFQIWNQNTHIIPSFSIWLYCLNTWIDLYILLRPDNMLPACVFYCHFNMFCAIVQHLGVLKNGRHKIPHYHCELERPAGYDLNLRMDVHYTIICYRPYVWENIVVG